MKCLIALLVFFVSQITYAGYIYECGTLSAGANYQANTCPDISKQKVVCVDGYRVNSAPSNLAEKFEDCKKVAALRNSNNPDVSVDSDCIKRYWMKGDTIQQQRLAKTGECKTTAQVEKEIEKDKEARIDYSGGNVTRIRSRSQHVSGHYRSNGTYVEPYKRAQR